MSNHAKQPNDVVILSGARTPVGRFEGALAEVSATELGAVAIRAAVERSGVIADDIAEVLMGQVVSAGSGQAPARQAGMAAGLPAAVGATTLSKMCASGLKAVMLAAQAIRAADADLLVAGGMENMSAVPFILPWARRGLRFGNEHVVDALIHDGLRCSLQGWMMGEAAEFIAAEYGLTREELDEFALRSHWKAIAAMDAGKFAAEIVPVPVRARDGTTSVVKQDQAPRRETSLPALAKLPPAFVDDGIVTAGNSPGLNDGAAALVVSSRARAQAGGQQPLARIVAYGQAAVEPKWLFDAPARAIPLVLEKAGWSLEDVDLIELNEAFAVQALANGRALAEKGWDWDKVNVHGGAIALGHAVGSSGARILVTLLHALRDRSLRRGLASLCLGGGEALAMAIEAE